MAVVPLLAGLPWGWRVALGSLAVLAVGGAFGLGFKKGFDAGHTAAKAKGDAAYAALERNYAERYAKALEENAARLRHEAENALQAGAALARAREEHAAIQQTLRARIGAVTRNSVHRFSPDFVRLFNEAVGAADSVSTGKSPGAAGGSAASAGGSAADSGVWGNAGKDRVDNLNVSGENAPGRFHAVENKRGSALRGAAGRAGNIPGPGDEPGASLPGLVRDRETAMRVTERDILAYIVYYGKRVKDMEAQVNALIRIVGEQHERD